MTDFTPVPTGTDVLVNTTMADDQRFPSVAALAGGGFVVTWSSLNQDGSGWGVYGQRYTAAGALSDGEFQINSTTADSQLYSAVTALADGGFVVTWTGPDGSGTGVFAQRYNAAGVPSGEFRVSAATLGGQLGSSVTALAGGGFVVTWTSDGQDGNSSGIIGRQYDASGAPGGEFLVNAATAGAQEYPSVTALSDGGFVVTWTSIDGSGTRVNGQRFAANGLKLGSEFQLNQNAYGYNESYYGSEWVDQLADGRLVATWQEAESGGIFDIRFRLIDVPVNTLPTASPVSLGSMLQNSGTRTITAAELLAGVTDIDGPQPAITALEIQSGSGTVSQVDATTWSYRPAPNDSSSVTFSYTASDGSGQATSTASLDLAVGHPLPTSPFAFWAFDETSGSTAADQAGGHTGTLVSGPAHVAGVTGNALHFDGSQYVSVPDSPAWNLGSGDFTLNMWVNFDAVPGGTGGHPGDILIGQDVGGGTNQKWFLSAYAGNLGFLYLNIGVGGQSISAPFSPVAGQWYDVAFARSGGTFQFYVNGNLVGTAPANFALPEVGAPLYDRPRRRLLPQWFSRRRRYLQSRADAGRARRPLSGRLSEPQRQRRPGRKPDHPRPNCGGQRRSHHYGLGPARGRDRRGRPDAVDHVAVDPVGQRGSGRQRQPDLDLHAGLERRHVGDVRLHSERRHAFCLLHCLARRHTGE